MSITDELREYAQSWRETPNLMDDLDAGDIDGLLGDFEHIADRIDAEHERLMRERRGCIHYDQERHYCNVHDLTTEDYKRGYDDGFASADDWLGQHESDMAEHGWIRLPKDADGEPIHAGDTLDGYGRTIEVVEMRHGRSGWVLISRDGNGYADTFAFAHHHEPTVEDVLRDVVTLCHNTWEEGSAFEFYDVDDVMKSSNIAEYAAKLRLAESEDA